MLPGKFMPVEKPRILAELSLLRGNRLGLLKALFDQFNAVADIAKLAV